MNVRIYPSIVLELCLPKAALARHLKNKAVRIGLSQLSKLPSVFPQGCGWRGVQGVHGEEVRGGTSGGAKGEGGGEGDGAGRKS